MRRALAVLLLLGSLAFGAEAAQAVPAISIDDVTVAEGTGTNTNAEFTVSLSEPAGTPFSVQWTASNGSGSNAAVEPADFGPGGSSPESGTVQFLVGETSKTLQVPVVGDSTDEFDETFRVSLHSISPGDAATFAPGGATGDATITDDDAPPTVTVEDTVVQGGSVSTGTNRLVIFNVKLSEPSGKTVTVDLFTRDPAGPIDDGKTHPAIACPTSTCSRTQGDYLALRETKTFNPGTTSLQSQVVAIGDSLDVNKYLELVAESRTHLHSQTGDFEQSDVGKTITVAGVTNTIASWVSESEVILANPAENGSNVTFAYDRDDDGDQDTHVDANVIGGTNQTIADGVGIGRIPSAGPSARITGVAVNEGQSGESVLAQLTVTLDNAAPQELSMAIASADGSARAPGDYERIPAGQRVTFQPNTTTATISVRVFGNDLNEADKAFNVTLSDPRNVTLTASNATAVVTIRNDDATPGIVAPGVAVAEPRAGTTSTAVVDVSLSAPSARSLSAPYSTRDGSAVAGVNYGTTSGTLTFAPGETSKQVQIPIAGNGTVTEDLSFSLVVQDTADGGGEVVADVRLIESDLTADTMPALGINDVSLRDSGRDGAEAVFTVRMDRPLGRRVTVDYATADGSARAPGDYTPRRGTIAIPAGQTSQVIGVPVELSGRRRRNESFSVVLSNAVSARIVRDTGAGIIIADTEESLPVRMSSRTVRGSSLLCTRGRRCSGLLMRWRAPASGRVRVSVTALVPVSSRRRGARRSQVRMRRVSIVKKTYRVRRGSRAVRVRRSAGRRTSRLLRQLRRRKARTVVVTVSFTDRLGARRTTRVQRRLRP